MPSTTQTIQLANHNDHGRGYWTYVPAIGVNGPDSGPVASTTVDVRHITGTGDDGFFENWRFWWVCFRGLTVPKDSTINAATLSISQRQSSGQSGTMSISAKAVKTTNESPPTTSADLSADWPNLTTASSSLTVQKGGNSGAAEVWNVASILTELTAQSAWSESSRNVLFYFYPPNINATDLARFGYLTNFNDLVLSVTYTPPPTFTGSFLFGC